MEIIYFCDSEDNVVTIRGELHDIQRRCEKIGFTHKEVLAIKVIHSGVIVNLNFDILFFDYGGAGNNRLHSYARQIVTHAKEHPSKIYIITSAFSAEAVADWFEEKPINLYMNFKDAIPYLKNWNIK